MNEDSKVKVLMEQHNSELKSLNEGMKFLLSKIPAIETKLDATFEAVGELQVDMNLVKTELRAIRNELTDKISRTEYLKLEKRVIFLEKKLRV